MSVATARHGVSIRESRLLSAMPAKAWAWWLAVVGPAVPVIALALAQADGAGRRFALLAAAAAAAQLCAVHLTGRRVFHPAIVFVVAGALILPPELLVVMCVVQHLPDWLKKRYAWYIQPFTSRTTSSLRSPRGGRRTLSRKWRAPRATLSRRPVSPPLSASLP